MNPKIKNYGMWIAIISNFIMGLQLIGVPITPEQFEAYMIFANITLTLLSALGIISNPEKGQWYKDNSNKLGK